MGSPMLSAVSPAHALAIRRRRVAAAPTALAALLTAALLASGCSVVERSAVTHCSAAAADSDSEAIADDAATTQQAGAGLECNATVTQVIDGDTILVVLDGQSSSESVRLLGIDTPETNHPSKPVQCYGAEASAYLTQLLPKGTAVTLIRDVEPTDQYDRLLAYVVRTDDMMFVNLDLVEQGYAAVLTYEPNTTHAADLSAAESRARSAQAGLWGFCGGPDVPLG